MEIQPNQKAIGLSPAAVNRTATRLRHPESDQVSLAASAAINQALENTPDKRAEVIERAKKLVADPTYPPRETIERLSQLLALRLSRE